METADIPDATPSEWQPITDKRVLAVLGKTAEEAGELVSAVSRCIIQGLDGREPTTGKINRAWLEEEIADVHALIVCLAAELDLDGEAIQQRAFRKIHYKMEWLNSLRAASANSN